MAFFDALAPRMMAPVNTRRDHAAAGALPELHSLPGHRHNGDGGHHPRCQCVEEGHRQLQAQLVEGYTSIRGDAHDLVSTDVRGHNRVFRHRHHCNGPCLAGRRSVGVGRDLGRGPPERIATDKFELQDAVTAQVREGRSLLRRGNSEFGSSGARRWHLS